MNCPSCGNEMEKGWMTAGGPQIRWFPEGEDNIMDYLSTFSSNERKIVSSKLSVNPRGIPAYLCQACRKLIADY